MAPLTKVAIARGRANRSKHRAVVCHPLTRHFGKESACA